MCEIYTGKPVPYLQWVGKSCTKVRIVHRRAIFWLTGAHTNDFFFPARPVPGDNTKFEWADKLATKMFDGFFYRYF